MISSALFNRGLILFRVSALATFLLVIYASTQVPLPSTSEKRFHSPISFTQKRNHVEKRIYTQNGETSISSPFSLLNYTQDGLVETLYDVQGYLAEEKGGRNFSAKRATFTYRTKTLTSPRLAFEMIDEKNVPYYSGTASDVTLYVKDGTPQFDAGAIVGSGEWE